jgi:hypothetical protein
MLNGSSSSKWPFEHLTLPWQTSAIQCRQNVLNGVAQVRNRLHGEVAGTKSVSTGMSWDLSCFAVPIASRRLWQEIGNQLWSNESPAQRRLHISLVVTESILACLDGSNPKSRSDKALPH